jgi:uncharacterized protein (DUF1697 family)
MKHIALLRAVNLGAHNKVSMERLCEVFASVGLGGARSLLQSGNVVFESSRRSPAALERLLEEAARKQLNLDTDFFVRTAEEWASIVENNPFPREAEADPGHLLLVCLREEPDSGSVEAFQAAIAGPETVRTVGRQAYITYPNGVGRSRVTTAIIERRLSRGTARNWNTVLKLAALVGT